jgi:hypothetical protein
VILPSLSRFVHLDQRDSHTGIHVAPLSVAFSILESRSSIATASHGGMRSIWDVAQPRNCAGKSSGFSVEPGSSSAQVVEECVAR